jgi:hypothetical protein
MALDKYGICICCQTKDKKKYYDELFFCSIENYLNFGTMLSIDILPELLMVEELLIAHVHITVNMLQVYR